MEQPKTVLVVEDYPPGRRALCACIEDLGYTVLAAGTASEARAIVAEANVGLLVVDVDRQAHRDLVHELRTRANHPSLLLVSGETAQEDVEPQPVTTLHKPLTFAGLADAIARVFGGR
jgi:DNA-binding NtrC family response regulator